MMETIASSSDFTDTWFHEFHLNLGLSLSSSFWPASLERPLRSKWCIMGGSRRDRCGPKGASWVVAVGSSYGFCCSPSYTWLAGDETKPSDVKSCPASWTLAEVLRFRLSAPPETCKSYEDQWRLPLKIKIKKDPKKKQLYNSSDCFVIHVKCRFLTLNKIPKANLDQIPLSIL